MNLVPMDASGDGAGDGGAGGGDSRGEGGGGDARGEGGGGGSGDSSVQQPAQSQPRAEAPEQLRPLELSVPQVVPRHSVSQATGGGGGGVGGSAVQHPAQSQPIWLKLLQSSVSRSAPHVVLRQRLSHGAAERATRSEIMGRKMNCGVSEVELMLHSSASAGNEFGRYESGRYDTVYRFFDSRMQAPHTAASTSYRLV